MTPKSILDSRLPLDRFWSGHLPKSLEGGTFIVEQNRTNRRTVSVVIEVPRFGKYCIDGIPCKGFYSHIRSVIRIFINGFLLGCESEFDAFSKREVAEGRPPFGGLPLSLYL